MSTRGSAPAPERFRYPVVKVSKTLVKTAFEAAETLHVVEIQNDMENMTEHVFDFNSSGTLGSRIATESSELNQAIAKLHNPYALPL